MFPLTLLGIVVAVHIIYFKIKNKILHTDSDEFCLLTDVPFLKNPWYYYPPNYAQVYEVKTDFLFYLARFQV
jgi:hypothetical protein